MARALTTTETRVYAAAAKGIHLEVRVKDESGTWVNLCSLEGQDWVEEVEHNKDIDVPVESATIRLSRSIYDFKLSPLYSASKINNPSGGAQERFGINREIVVRVAVLPAGHGDPASTDWRLLFHGDVDEIDVAGMTLRCVDLGGRLQRLKMERAAQPDASPGGGAEVESGDPYVAEGASEAAEDVMQAILDDWAPSLSITLHTPTSPSWDLTENYKPPPDASVLDALRHIASMIGWDVRYVFDSSLNDPITAAATGDFRLRFYEPDRSNTTPDLTLTSDQYRDVTALEDILSSVANRVEVMYWDSPLPDERIMRSVISEDSGSQTAFGVLYMRVSADAVPGIQTQADAEDLADAILHDVSDPTAAMGVTADFRYDVELYDLIRFSANGELWDSNQDLAVAGVRNHFSGGRCSTHLSLRGTIAGHRAPWWQSGGGMVDDGLPGYDGPISDRPYGGGASTPNTPNLLHDIVLGGAQFRVENPPTDYERIEFHVSTSGPSFTPDETTVMQSVQGTASGTVSLPQGTTHYARAVVVGRGGVRSAPSTAVTFSPGTTIGNKPHSDGMPYAATIDRATVNAIENPSFEVNTAGWSVTNSGGDTSTIARDTAVGLFGDIAAGTNCSLKVTVGASGGNVTGIYCDSQLAATVGDEVSASIWVLHTAAEERSFTLFIEGYDSGGAFEESISDTSVLVQPNVWTRITLPGTVADADTVGVRMGLETSSLLGDFDAWLDGAQLESGAYPSSYADGSMGSSYAWSGTPHDSTTTRSGGFSNHGAIAEEQSSVVFYEDGTVEAVAVRAPPNRSSVGVGGGVASGIVVGNSGVVSDPLQIAGSGTTFPAGPVSGDVFFRTDRGVLYYYDGSRWLTVHEYVCAITPWVLPSTAYSATTLVGLLAVPAVPGSGNNIYLTGWEFAFYLGGTNDATDRWQIGLGTQPGTSLSSLDTGTPTDYASTTWHRIEQTMTGDRDPATDKYWHVTATKVNSPGTIQVTPGVVRYRGIG